MKHLQLRTKICIADSNQDENMNKTQLEKEAISVALPLEAARRASRSRL